MRTEPRLAPLPRAWVLGLGGPALLSWWAGVPLGRHSLAVLPLPRAWEGCGYLASRLECGLSLALPRCLGLGCLAWRPAVASCLSAGMRSCLALPRCLGLGCSAWRPAVDISSLLERGLASPCPVASGLGARLRRPAALSWWTGVPLGWPRLRPSRCLGLGWAAAVSLLVHSCGTGLHAAAPCVALVPPPPQRIIGYHWWPRPRARHCCQGHLADLRLHTPMRVENLLRHASSFSCAGRGR